MSIWDNIMSLVSGRGWDAGTAVSNSPVGSRFNSLANTVAQTVNPLTYTGAALNLGQRATDTASQGVAAGVIALNPDSKDYLSLVDAWNDASRQKISPGQAFASLPLMGVSTPNLLSHRLDNSPLTSFNGVPTGPHGGIDPTDPAVRKAAFEQRGSIGQLESFGVDTAFQYYLAPPVLFGQAAKPVIAATRGAARGRGGTQMFTEQQIGKIGSKLGYTPTTEALPVLPEADVGIRPAAANPIAAEAERLWGHVQAGNYGAIRENAVIRNSSDPGQTAATLFGAKSWDEFNTVLMAAVGDPVAYQRLRATAPVLQNALDIASNDLGKLEERAADWNMPTITPRGEPHPDWVATQTQLDDQRQLVANLVERNTWLRRAVGAGDEDDQGVWRTMSDQFFSPNRQLNAWRDAQAQRRAARGLSVGNTGHWAARPFTEGGVTVKVMHWFGSSIPSGMVSLAGNGRVASRDELISSAQQAGMDMATAWSHIARFEGAPTATEAQQAVVGFNNAVTRHVFAKVFPDIKVGSDQYKDMMATADKWLEQHGDQLSTALRQYENRGGYLWDEVHKVGYKIPQLESQEAQLMPLPDWGELETALRRQKDDWKKVFDSKVVTGPEHLAQFSLQLWKPLVLLRLGAVPKNVGESWLAGYVYLSRFAGNPVVGAGRIAANLGSYGADLATRAADLYDHVSFSPWKSSMFHAQAGAVGRQVQATQTMESAQRALDDLNTEMARNPALRIGMRQVYRPGQTVSHAALVAEQTAAVDSAGQVLDAATADLTRLKEIDVRRPRLEPGKTPITERGWQARGALADPIGEVSATNVSAAGKNRLVENQFTTASMDRRFTVGQLKATGQTVQYDPVADFPSWAAHATHFANTNVRNSRVALALLRGQSYDDISRWLRTTTDGRGLLHRLPAVDDYTKAGVDAYLHDLNHNLRALYPHEELQRLITEGPVNEAQVGGFLEHRKNTLVPVFDDELVNEIPRVAVDHLNAFVDKMFQNLWTKPEDRLARIPLYNTIYTQQVRAALRQYDQHLQSLSEADANTMIRDIEAAARERAITDVNRIVYSPRQRTVASVAGPLQAMRYLVPFYQVTTNRLTYYGSQLLENPQNMARLFVGWNAIGTTTDSEGNQNVTVAVPGTVAKALGLEDSPYLNFSKSSLNLINSGEPWYAPGFGPIVTIPMAAWLRDHPAETPDWLKTAVRVTGMFPHNYYGTSWTDQFGAAWMRRWGSSQSQEQRANLWAQIWAQEVMKHNNGLRDMPSDAEITKRVDAVGFLKVLAAFVLPAQPQYSAGQPGRTPPPPGSGQGARADMLTTMVDVHRKYTQQYGADGDTRFLADYPEYYDYMISLTQNPTGIQSTNAAVARAEQHAALVASLSDPRMGGLVTNLPDDYGKFEADAYNWEKGRPVVEGGSLVWRGQNPDAKDAYNNRVISRGWKSYVAAAQERDTLLKAAGFTSTRDAGAEWIKALFDWKTTSPDNPDSVLSTTSYKDSTGNWVTPWWDDFQSQDNATYAHRAADLGRILTADGGGYYRDNVGVQPWLRTAAAYLRERETIQTLLDAQQAAGGSGSITAQDNQWIADLWTFKTKQLSDADAGWAQIANSMFSHDDLSDVPLSTLNLAQVPNG